MVSNWHLRKVPAFIALLLLNTCSGSARDILTWSEQVTFQQSEGNPGEEYEYLLRQWKELYATILKEEKVVQNNFRTATNNQFKAAEQLRIAETNKKIVDPVRLATLQEDFDKSVESLGLAKTQQKEFKSLLEKAKKINLKPLAITEKKYNRIRSDYNAYLAGYSPERKIVNEPAASKLSPAETKVQEKKPATSAPPATKENEMGTIDPAMVNKKPSAYDPRQYASLPYACIYEKDTTDLVSGLSRRELAPSILFTHTDPDLRPYFKDKELITCRGRLSAIGPYMYLTIEFQIASSHSQSNFGSLQEGSLLRIKLMNDEFVSLYNLKTNEGHIDPYTGYTIFSAQYTIGKQEMKKLRSSEMDKMRVMWSTGFEDYDVYNIDLLINQINCLMSRK